MADIFLSYSSKDRDRVAPLAHAFVRLGWSVWWDPKIRPGEIYDQVIERELDAAGVVVCVWTPNSVNSEWVLNEAEVGRRRKVLVPVRLAEVEHPLAFSRRESADLTDWHPEQDHSGFNELTGAIEQLTGPRSALKVHQAEEARERQRPVAPETTQHSLTLGTAESHGPNVKQSADHPAAPSAISRLQVSGMYAGPYVELEFSSGDGWLGEDDIHRVIHRVERNRLDRVLRGMVGAAASDPRTQTMLYELLIPVELRPGLSAAENIELLVDEITAGIPWEMLAVRDPGGGHVSQLVLRAGFVRQLIVSSATDVSRRSTTATAFVLGDPPTSLPRLPGARHEAEEVAIILESSSYEVNQSTFDAQAEPGDDAMLEIELALSAEDYRIIHIAGHGVFRPDEPTRSGVMIGLDDYLTARTLGQLAATPNLVFLNCGKLSRLVVDGDDPMGFTSQNLHQFGASLALPLIRSGVQSVVTCGWSVDDFSAECFARRFYECMLDGEPFGQAVRRAREFAHQAWPTGCAEGAYQCYGDPTFTLPAT